MSTTRLFVATTWWSLVGWTGGAGEEFRAEGGEGWETVVHHFCEGRGGGANYADGHLDEDCGEKRD